MRGPAQSESHARCDDGCIDLLQPPYGAHRPPLLPAALPAQAPLHCRGAVRQRVAVRG